MTGGGISQGFRKQAVELSQTPDYGLKAKRIGRQGLDDLWDFNGVDQGRSSNFLPAESAQRDDDQKPPAM